MIGIGSRFGGVRVVRETCRYGEASLRRQDEQSHVVEGVGLMIRCSNGTSLGIGIESDGEAGKAHIFHGLDLTSCGTTLKATNGMFDSPAVSCSRHLEHCSGH